MDGTWIRKRLDALKTVGRKKSQSGLAKALGLEPPRVTEMIGGTRELQLDEVAECARYLELSVEMVVAARH